MRNAFLALACCVSSLVAQTAGHVETNLLKLDSLAPRTGSQLCADTGGLVGTCSSTGILGTISSPYLPVATGAGVLANSSVSDNGSQVSTTLPFSASSLFVGTSEVSDAARNLTGNSLTDAGTGTLVLDSSRNARVNSLSLGTGSVANSGAGLAFDNYRNVIANSITIGTYPSQTTVIDPGRNVGNVVNFANTGTVTFGGLAASVSTVLCVGAGGAVSVGTCSGGGGTVASGKIAWIDQYGAVCNGTNQHSAVVAALQSGAHEIGIPAGCTWVLPTTTWTYTVAGTTYTVLPNTIPGGETSACVESEAQYYPHVGPYSFPYNSTAGAYTGNGCGSGIRYIGENWLTSVIQTATASGGPGFPVAPGANIYLQPLVEVQTMNLVGYGCTYWNIAFGADESGYSCPVGDYRNLDQSGSHVFSSNGLEAFHAVGTADRDHANIHVEGNSTGDSVFSGSNGPGAAYRALTMSLSTFYNAQNPSGIPAGGFGFYAQKADDGYGFYGYDDGSLGSGTGGYGYFWYTAVKTIGDLLYFAHRTSTFTGNAIELDMAQGCCGGTFTGNFIYAKNGGVPQFTVDHQGNVTSVGTMTTGGFYTSGNLTALGTSTLGTVNASGTVSASGGWSGDMSASGVVKTNAGFQVRNYGGGGSTVTVVDNTGYGVFIAGAVAGAWTAASLGISGSVQLSGLSAGSGSLAVVCRDSSGYLYSGGCGSGGSGLSGGVTNAIPMWTSSSTMGNSSMSQIAGTLYVSSQLNVTGSITGSGDIDASGDITGATLQITGLGVAVNSANQFVGHGIYIPGYGASVGSLDSSGYVHATELGTSGNLQASAMPTSPVSGTGAYYVCIDSVGYMYRKSSCP